MSEQRYQIIESELGPLISESRSSVFDVLRACNDGRNLYEIAMLYNLTPVQVQTALDYIAIHRERLQAELSEILYVRQEREAHYRQVAAEIDKKIAQQPMTPQRQKFLEWRKAQRAVWLPDSGREYANGSQ